MDILFHAEPPLALPWGHCRYHASRNQVHLLAYDPRVVHQAFEPHIPRFLCSFYRGLLFAAVCKMLSVLVLHSLAQLQDEAQLQLQ